MKIASAIQTFTALSLCAGFIAFLSFNYSGYCWENNRWLSDQERIDIVVRDILFSKDISVFKDNGTWSEYPSLMSKDIKSFYSENPDCCHLVSSHPDYRITHLSRAFGQYSEIVSINFTAKYMNNNRKEERLVRRFIETSNCGVPYTPPQFNF